MTCDSMMKSKVRPPDLVGREIVHDDGQAQKLARHARMVGARLEPQHIDAAPLHRQQVAAHAAADVQERRLRKVALPVARQHAVDQLRLVVDLQEIGDLLGIARVEISARIVGTVERLEFLRRQHLGQRRAAHASHVERAVGGESPAFHAAADPARAVFFVRHARHAALTAVM
jgi:hypothetical protein